MTRVRISRAAERKRLLATGAACLITAVLWAALFLGPGAGINAVNRAQTVVQDALLAQLPRPDLSEAYVFVAIDQGSLLLDTVEDGELEASAELQAMLDGFPWPRSVIAGAVRKLLDAGARLVTVDLIFELPGEEDAPLAEVLREFPGQVVIGSNFVWNIRPDGTEQTSLVEPAETILPGSEPARNRVGFVNFWADESDGMIRRARYFTSLEELSGLPAGERKPSLAAAMLLQLGEEMPPSVRNGFHAFVPSRMDRLRVVPFYQLFVPAFWEKNLGGGEVFRDKIVMIGPQAELLQDFHVLPVVDRVPGAVVHLHALEALRKQAFYTPFPIWGNLLLFAFFAAGAVLIIWKAEGSLVPLALLVVWAGVAVGVSVAFLRGAALLPETLETALGSLVTGLVGLGVSFTIQQREAARTRSMLDRYVSHHVVAEILERQDRFFESLGGSRKEVAVLFSDVRGFTSFSEHGDPTEVVHQLNGYLERMVDLIFEERGTVDKFIGDGIMAFWGGVISAGAAGDATRAVRAALGMRGGLRELNERWALEGREPFRVGIGVNFGPVVFGNIGSDRKMEMTVIGDAVNLASRIEGATKRYKLDLLISQSVREQLPSEFVVQPVDRVRVVGRRQPVDLFTVLGTGEEPDWLAPYRRAVTAFRAGAFEEAAAGFLEVSASEPNGLCALYLERCTRFRESPPGEGWDGATNLDSK